MKDCTGIQFCIANLFDIALPAELALIPDLAFTVGYIQISFVYDVPWMIWRSYFYLDFYFSQCIQFVERRVLQKKKRIALLVLIFIYLLEMHQE